MSRTPDAEHDFVIVVAGSSGSVIARRLLDRGHSVHIIEAGPADTDERVHSPQGWPLLLQSELD
jgi:choline dehydrogenase